MNKSKIFWWTPDKIVKDIILEDIIQASKYSKGRLLDIGCGNKPYKFIFNGKVDLYVGLDNKNKNADIKVDFYKAKLKSNSFDTILCTQVIEHVSDPSKLIKRMYKILSKNGHVILTAPFVGSLHEEPTDFFRFTKYSLSFLFKSAGFKILYIKEEGNWMSSISNLVCFYLEGTLNKFYLRVPKKIILAIIQVLFYFLSRLPARFTKPEKCPMNYIVVAAK